MTDDSRRDFCVIYIRRSCAVACESHISRRRMILRPPGSLLHDTEAPAERASCSTGDASKLRPSLRNTSRMYHAKCITHMSAGSDPLTRAIPRSVLLSRAFLRILSATIPKPRPKRCLEDFLRKDATLCMLSQQNESQPLRQTCCLRMHRTNQELLTVSFARVSMESCMCFELSRRRGFVLRSSERSQRTSPDQSHLLFLTRSRLCTITLLLLPSRMRSVDVLLFTQLAQPNNAGRRKYYGYTTEAQQG